MMRWIGEALAAVMLTSTAYAETTEPTPAPAPSPNIDLPAGGAVLSAPSPVFVAASDKKTAAADSSAAAGAAGGDVSTGAVKLKVDGTVYLLYSYDVSPAASGQNNYNAFDVSRAYITLLPSYGDDYYGRVTVDVSRLTENTSGGVNVTGSLVDRLKYAYLGHKQGPVDFRAGLQPAPWDTFEEDIWLYRVLSPVLVDSFLQVSSSDFGFSGMAKAMGGRLEIHSGVFNGAGFSQPDVAKGKEWDTRVTYQLIEKPQGGLKLSGYYGYAIKDAVGTEKQRIIGLATYQGDGYTVGLEGVHTIDGTGGGGPENDGNAESVWGWYRLPVKNSHLVDMRALLRYDYVDPNNNATNDIIERWIAGVAFRGTEKTQLVLDYQQLNFQGANNLAKNRQVLFAHWEMLF